MSPAIADAVLDGVIEELRPLKVAHEASELRVELQKIDRELERLTEAIALGGQAVPQILEGMRLRQSRRDQLAASLHARERVDIGR